MVVPPGSDPFCSRFWCDPRTGLAWLPDTLTELRGSDPFVSVQGDQTLWLSQVLMHCRWGGWVKLASLKVKGLTPDALASPG